MDPATVEVFPIRFAPFPRVVFALAGLTPSRSHVSVSADRLSVRFGWGFVLDAPLSALLSVRPRTSKVLELGVHGFARRWIVNGSYRNLVELRFASPVAARVGFVPVSVSKLTVSLDSPAALLSALSVSRG